MKERWFRFYDGVPFDPKILRLSEHLRWQWITMLCLASQNDGALPSLEDLALILREKPERLERDLGALVDGGLMDVTDSGQLRPHNWNGRQYQNDRSTERVKRFRERHKKPDETVSETSPDSRGQKQNTETDTDINPEAAEHGSGASEAGRGLAELETKLREAAGWQSEPNPSLCVVGPIQALLESGASLDLDVLPTIRALAPKVRTRSNWRYFVGPIQDAMAARVNAKAPPIVSLDSEAKRREARRRIEKHNARVEAERVHAG